MKIFVPSYGRAGQSTTMAKIPSAVIVVPEKQKTEYEVAYPGRVLAIPDDKDGNVAKKRNAVLELVEYGELFWMLDDDLVKADFLKSGPIEDIEQILESVHSTMESGGFDFGGFNVTSDPVKYAEYAPFSLTKPSYQAVCLRRIEGISYDLSLKRFEDMDIFLQYLKHSKMVFRDNRIFLTFLTNKDKATTNQKGGIVGNDLDHEDAKLAILTKWGNLIRVKNGIVAGINSPVGGP